VNPDLPRDLQDVADAFGSRLRVAVLHSLAKTGPATLSELSRRLDVQPSSLSDHVARLEQLGVLDVDPPRSEPGRLMRTFSIDHRRSAEIAETVDKLLGR
jgi:DNA-binding transcriptional ArsR family regulator